MTLEGILLTQIHEIFFHSQCILELLDFGHGLSPSQCAVAIKLIWDVYNFGAPLKFFLVHFNILNGILSTTHLCQLNLDESNEIVMVAFVILFILQAVFNVILTISNFFFDSPFHNKESRPMMIAKFVIAFVLRFQC